MTSPRATSAPDRFDLLIFDCDGVVVDSEAITQRVFGELLRELGLRLSREELYETFIGRSLDACLALAEQRLGTAIPRARVDRYLADRDAALRAEVEPMPGIRELVSSLDIPYCIASSGGHDKMRVTLGATDLLALFEGRIFSAVDVENPKPAPDVFLLAAQTMGADPQRTAVIEDTETGVRAGRAARMTVFGFAPETPADRLVDAGAHAVFGHLRELQSFLSESGRVRGGQAG